MSTLLERARRGERLDELGIIDMHCHLGRVAHAVPWPEADGLLRTMDRIGIATACCAHIRCLSGQIRAGNDDVAAAARAHPGRIRGYVILWPASRQAVAEEVERCLGADRPAGPADAGPSKTAPGAAGFIGIKVHSGNGFSYDDPAYEPAYAAADERRMPILYHTWGQTAEFAAIDRVAGRFGRARHLLGHAGSADPDAYVAFAAAHANVVLELCFSRCPRGLVERLVADLQAAERPAGSDAPRDRRRRDRSPRRIVWGSDATFLNQAQQIGKVLGADLPDATKRRLLADNARDLLADIRT